MSFQIALNKFQKSEAILFEELQIALLESFSSESVHRGLTQEKMAEDLGVDPSTVSKWLRLQGNPTLKTIAKLYASMDLQPWSNLKAPSKKKNIVINAEGTKKISNKYNESIYIINDKKIQYPIASKNVEEVVHYAR